MSKSTLETITSEFFDNANSSCEQAYRETEEKIRTSPMAAVGIAAAAGYVFAFLPAGKLLGLTIRTVIFTQKPALLIFGAIKVVQAISECSCNKSAGESEREPLLDSPAGPEHQAP